MCTFIELISEGLLFRAGLVLAQISAGNLALFPAPDLDTLNVYPRFTSFHHIELHLSLNDMIICDLEMVPVQYPRR